MRKIKTGDAVLRMLFAVYAIVVAVLLAAAAITIYQEGTAPENVLGNGVYVHPIYSVEIVAQHFEPIAGIVYGFLGFALLMIVLELFRSKPKTNPSQQTLPMVGMLECRMGADKQDTPEAQAVRSERRYRKRLFCALCAVCLVCIAVSAIWLLNPSSFASQEMESVMGQFVLHVFPWIGLVLAASMTVAELANRSALRELPFLRKVLTKKNIAEDKPASNKPKTVLRAALYVLAIGFVIWGISNGGMRDVLFKAINICTECVGLG